MAKNFSFSFSFDDVLLRPRYSEVVPTEVDVSSFLTAKIPLPVPIISSAMDTVTESRMALAMARLGGVGVIHKNLPATAQAEEVAKVKSGTVVPGAAVDESGKLLAAAAVGTTGDFLQRAALLQKAGVNLLVIDTAHGHSHRVLRATKEIKRKLKKVFLAAGNVATYDGAKALLAAGVDAVKVGVGPGSICTTRMVSGCGVPQLTAIMEAARAIRGSKAKLIADGGIKYSGDLTKAIAAGADCVMIGGLLGGTDEAPGAVFELGGKKFKSYRGMGSLGAMNQGSRDRYGQDKVVGGKLVPEGVEARVPYRGPVSSVIEQLVGGLRSGMGYCGARKVAELKRQASWTVITSAGLRESHVHDVQIDKKAPNYGE